MSKLKYIIVSRKLTTIKYTSKNKKMLVFTIHPVLCVAYEKFENLLNESGKITENE